MNGLREILEDLFESGQKVRTIKDMYAYGEKIFNENGKILNPLIDSIDVDQALSQIIDLIIGKIKGLNISDICEYTLHPICSSLDSDDFKVLEEAILSQLKTMLKGLK